MQYPCFLGSEIPDPSYDDAAYVVLPIPYEQTTSYMKGTEFGPNAIIRASSQLEDYDDELGFAPLRAGIYTAAPLDTVLENPEDENQLIYRAVREYLADGKVVAGVGGEHSISYGAVRACLEFAPDLTVLHLDAHADLRTEYEGWRFSHAAVMRRIRDLTAKTVSVGVRSYSSGEREYIEANGVRLFSAGFVRSRNDWLEQVLSQLEGPLYISLDLDVMDPAIVPGVGTPEPGGLDWWQITSLLRTAIQRCQLLAFDLVELCPTAVNHVSEFVAAKLVYKIIGYDCLARRRVASG
jgi:agmatinase